MNKVSSKSVNYLTVALSLLFLIDFVTYLDDIAPVAILKVSAYGIAMVVLLLKWNVLPVNNSRNSIVWKLIGLYLFLMFIRLIADFVVPDKGFFLYQSSYTIMFFFVMTMVLPYILCRLKHFVLNKNLMCVICCVVITICLALSLNKILTGSLVAATTGGQYDTGTIDIISYGHYGLSLLFISVYIWIFSPKPWLVLFTIAGVLIGISGIVLSGSRSPIIALVVGVFIFVLSRLKNWFKIIPYIITLLLLSFIIEDILYTFNDWLSDNGISSFTRILESLFGDHSSVGDVADGRDSIFKQGIILFWENFFWGYGYLLPDNSYVHNIFIENYMALGVIGGSIFLIFNVVAIKRAIYIIKYEPSNCIYVVLFAQYLILGFFSRTSIAIAPYWLFLFLVLNLYDRIQHEKYICNNSDLQESRRLN